MNLITFLVASQALFPIGSAQTIQDSIIVETPARMMKAYQDDLVYLTFSKSGNLMATVSANEEMRIYGTEPFQVLRTIADNEMRACYAAFSPDEKTLVSVSEQDDQARFWDVDSGEIKHSTTLKLSGSTHAAYTPDGKTVVVAGIDVSIQILDAETGELKKTISGYGSIHKLAIAPDGKTAISSDVNGVIRVWSLPTWSSLKKFDGAGTEIGWSPNGKMVAAAREMKDGSSRVTVWNPESWEEVTSFSASKETTQALVFSPDSKLIATASNDGTVRLWESTTGKAIRVFKPKPAKNQDFYAYTLGFTKDGKQLLSGSMDGMIEFWAVPDQK